MTRHRYATEEIIHLLREVSVPLGQGKSIAEACKTIGASDHTCFHTRRQFRGLRVDQAKRLDLRLNRTCLVLKIDPPLCSGMAVDVDLGWKAYCHIAKRPRVGSPGPGRVTAALPAMSMHPGASRTSR